jgi:hypothetical protein
VNDGRAPWTIVAPLFVVGVIAASKLFPPSIPSPILPRILAHPRDAAAERLTRGKVGDPVEAALLSVRSVDARKKLSSDSGAVDRGWAWVATPRTEALRQRRSRSSLGSADAKGPERRKSGALESPWMGPEAR